jgi:hypothetical protein
MFPVESESECVYAQLQSQFAASYSAAGVKYYIEHTGENPQTIAMEKLISEKAEWFELLWSSPQDVYRIYRIRLGSNVKG